MKVTDSEHLNCICRKLRFHGIPDFYFILKSLSIWIERLKFGINVQQLVSISNYQQLRLAGVPVGCTPHMTRISTWILCRVSRASPDADMHDNKRHRPMHSPTLEGTIRTEPEERNGKQKLVAWSHSYVNCSADDCRHHYPLYSELATMQGKKISKSKQRVHFKSA